MIPDCFRQDVSGSIVQVPGAGVSDQGAAAARMVDAVMAALRDARSLRVTPSGVTESAGDDRQWLMVQSAGSTGAPKTIRRRPASWKASFAVTRSHFGIGPEMRYAVLGAVSHSLTLYALLEALHIGCNVSVLTGLRPRTQVRLMDERDVQVLYATPTLLRLLAAATTSPLPKLRRVFCGGGTLDPLTRAELARLFPGATVHEFFGASETSFMTISDADTPEGSVGRAYPGVELRVRDKWGRDTQEGGEIWVNSPYLFDGYADGDSVDTRWDGKFLSIGEMGRVDRAGNLFVLGRKNRMVTVSDQNVYPEMIEAQLRTIPGVGLCAAIAVPDRQRGHVIVAVFEGPPNEALAQRALEQCRAGLASPAVPRRIVFVEQMPLLAAGKPDLVALAYRLEHAA